MLCKADAFNFHKVTKFASRAITKLVSHKVLIDTIEDRAIYEELKNLKFDIETIMKAD